VVVATLTADSNSVESPSMTFYSLDGTATAASPFALNASSGALSVAAPLAVGTSWTLAFNVNSSAGLSPAAGPVTLTLTVSLG
jgi:hypothetical protein